MTSLLFASTLAAFSFPPPSAVDIDRVILAIEAKENGQWSSVGGRACWKQATWAQFTTWDFRHSSNPILSRTVMRWALDSYARRFTKEGIDPSVWRLAMAWRFGFDGAKRVRRLNGDYAEMVENIYNSLPPAK